MQKTALEHDLQKLVEKALALGASGAKTVDVASIRTGAWTRWKCQFGCPNYGKTLCCPPFVPDYAATQRFLQEFIRGIIIQYTFPLNGVKLHPHPLMFLSSVFYVCLLSILMLFILISFKKG